MTVFFVGFCGILWSWDRVFLYNSSDYPGTHLSTWLAPASKGQNGVCHHSRPQIASFIQSIYSIYTRVRLYIYTYEFVLQCLMSSAVTLNFQFILLLFTETRLHPVAYISFQLTVLTPSPVKCCVCRCVPPGPAFFSLNHRSSCLTFYSCATLS